MMVQCCKLISPMDLLHSNYPLGLREDNLVLKLKRNRKFEVHSFHETLRGSNQVLLRWKKIWYSKVTRKVTFFAWMRTLNDFDGE